MNFAAQLPEAHEYAVGSWGQSNNNPRGLLSEALPEGPHLLGVNGRDLTVSDLNGLSGAGSVVNIAETIAAGTWVGAELRVIHPVYGQAHCPAYVGKATVTGSTASTLIVTWDVNPVTPVADGGGLADFAAANTINYLAHLYQNGSRIIFGGAPLPPEVTAGVQYFVVNRTANTFQISLTLGGAPLAFTAVGPGAASLPQLGIYLHYPDGRGLSFSHIRVLTPYLPEITGGYPAGVPAVPNRTFPASITSYEDAGLFLDFTFNEGVDGYGVSNSGGTVTYAADRVTDSSLALLTNVLKGGYIQVGGQLRQIASNTATAILLTVNWTVTPSAATEYEAFVPHYRDNPHSRTVGFGFRYPSNHSQPGYLAPNGSQATTYNRPRARLTPSYVPVSGTGAAAVPEYRMGQMVEMAWQLSSRIGRRLNVVHLAVDSSSLIHASLLGGATTSNLPVGWWTTAITRDWLIDSATSLAARFRKMLLTMAPAALVAESNTRTLRYLGEAAFQGESETLTIGRNIYHKLLATIHGWLRTIIKTAGYSYYPNAADMPVVHASLNPAWQAVDDVTGGLVQTAIDDWTAADPAALTIDVSDSPTQGLDPAHFNGLGEFRNGDLSGGALGDLIDEFAIQAVDTTGVDIANLALSFIGATARVFSLDTTVDQSTEARVCSQFFQVARDEVLEKHTWSFATKFATLTPVTNDRTDWSFAYALPTNLARPLEVLPPTAVPALAPPGEMTPWWRNGSASGDPFEALDTMIVQTPGHRFSVERNVHNELILYTDVDQAVLRYTIRITAQLQVPMQFRIAVARKLAALIAGPLVSGETGARTAMTLEAIARMDAAAANATDANHQQLNPMPQRSPWNR